MAVLPEELIVVAGLIHFVHADVVVLLWRRLLADGLRFGLGDAGRAILQ